MSYDDMPHGAPHGAHSALTLWVLALLAAGFLIAAISFATSLYHVQEAQAAEANKGREAAPPPDTLETPAQPSAPEFSWGTYLGGLFLSDPEYGPAFVWSLLGFLTAGLAALWTGTAAVKPGTDPAQRDRLAAFLAGALIGLLTLLVLGLGYTWHWWSLLTGSRENWKEYKTWLPVGCILLGLAVMFLSMLPLRAEERRSPALRRLFYGYNAFLSCLLLLGVLAVVNVMIFFYFTHSFDWTGTHIYSVSPQTRKVLAALDRPVKVHVFLNPQGPFAELYTDLRSLLDSCQGYSDKLTVEFVSPERDPARYTELLSQFEVVSHDLALETAGQQRRLGLYGLLVVYDWEAKDRKPASHFVGLQDLEPGWEGRLRGQDLRRQFQGEKALLSALTFLQEGELNHMLLFSAGNGELSLTQAGAGGPSPTSLTRLSSLLRTQSGYECRPFLLGSVDPATGQPRPVPSLVRLKTPAEQQSLPFPEEDWIAVSVEEKQRDTDKRRKYYRILAVVLADPAQVSPVQLQVLREHLATPEGRVIAFLDVHRDRAGRMQRTGLEVLLRQYGAGVGESQVLQRLSRHGQVPAELRDPATAAGAVPTSADLSLQMASARLGLVFFPGARPVRPVQAAADPTLRAQVFVHTEQLHWEEAAPLTNAAEFVEKLTPEEIQRKERVQPHGMPLAVTVTQVKPPAEGQQPRPQPKLVVFGDITFLSDQQLRGPGANYTLFANALAWLRGRKDLIGDGGPVSRSSYRLTSPERLPVWSAGLLLLAAVTAAGIGVTLLRRK